MRCEYQAVQGSKIVGRFGSLVAARMAWPLALAGEGVEIALWEEIGARMRDKVLKLLGKP